MGSTDDFDTFITAAPDSRAAAGTVPPMLGSIARGTFDLIVACVTSSADSASICSSVMSDDVIYTGVADRLGTPDQMREAARAEYFSRDRACLRSSDLGKRYGWGLLFDKDGYVSLVGIDEPRYAALADGHDPDGRPLTVLHAMRSRRG